MGILTLYQRTGIVALGILFTVLIAIIHRTEDVRFSIAAGLLILAGTRLVVSLHPVVGLLEIRTVASLVAQRPNNDARMILERHHITLLTLKMCPFKVLTLGQCTVAIAHAVALQVRLSRQVDAILVAEVVPTGIVGIVTGTYSVDIHILHNLDILNHPLHRDDVPAIGIKLMTVGTFY